MKHSNRRVVVFTTLIGVLTLTSALLLALAPAPLTPDASTSLFAIDAPEAIDAIFRTQSALKGGQWKYIYIHHSRTPSGNASTLSRPEIGMADHFVIGNGEGAIDGEIQVGPRWMQQQSAAAPLGATAIDPGCISICMVGDFDRSTPTPTQLRRLTQLINALQTRFDIPASRVLAMNQPAGNASVGRYFAVTAFREQLLP